MWPKKKRQGGSIRYHKHRPALLPNTVRVHSTWKLEACRGNGGNRSDVERDLRIFSSACSGMSETGAAEGGVKNEAVPHPFDVQSACPHSVGDRTWLPSLTAKLCNTGSGKWLTGSPLCHEA